MKYELVDERGQAVVIDLEPNAEPEVDHLYVTVRHDREGEPPAVYEGRLFQGGASDMEKRRVSVYGREISIGDLLVTLYEHWCAGGAVAGADVERFFTGVGEMMAQCGLIEPTGQEGRGVSAGLKHPDWTGSKCPRCWTTLTKQEVATFKCAVCGESLKCGAEVLPT